MKLSAHQKNLLRLSAVVFAISAVVSLLTLFVNYPTQAHIDAARELNNPSNTTSFENIMKNKEQAYITIAGMTTAVIGFIVYVWLVFFTYKKIRTDRLAKQTVLATVGVMFVAGVFVAAIQSTTTYFYLGAASASNNVGLPLLIMMAMFGQVFNVIFTFLIALLADSRFNRKHSFLVE